MVLNLKQIEELIASDITSYQISKNTGISSKTIDRYRNRDTIDSMSIATAVKLQQYINKEIKNGTKN